MGYYVKKPIVIQAVRFGETGFDEMPNWLKQAFNMGFWRFDCELDGTFCGFIVETLEGEMRGSRGDYIIQGVEGELYPCRGDIFEKTYEKAKVIKDGE